MGIWDSLARLFGNSAREGQQFPQSDTAPERKNVKSYLFWTIAAMLLAFVAFSGNARTEAAAVINYNATEVHIPGGQTIISGYFVNSGDVGALVTYVELSVSITDPYGNYIWNDSSNFSNVGAYVPAGGSAYHTFTIWNDNAPRYDATIKWHVDTHMYWQS